MAVSSLTPFHTIDKCIHCHSLMESSARFCGECGAPGDKARASSQTVQSDSFAKSFAAHKIQGPLHHGQLAPNNFGSYENQSSTQGQVRQLPRPAIAPHQPGAVERAPNFAPVPQQSAQEIPAELREELGKYIVLLARERFFLYMHCTIFLTMNLFGFWLSMTAYHGYVGDEITKFIMSLTPLMFINSIALACLSPIKGTKREIARLKEKIAYVRFQIDYRTFFK